MKDKIFKLIFSLWMILWLSFIARELFWKGHFYDYRILLSRSLEGKRSYVIGDRLYEFLIFCNKNLPPEAGYEPIGLEEGSLAKRRATYYLYPHLEKRDAEFMLIYDRQDIRKSGYDLFAELDEARYILKKKVKE